MRRNIVERFISRWRAEVGDDFYPAMRLIVPDKDRDRPMYGLKEKAICKLLLRLMKIDKNSEDGSKLANWKLPGQNKASHAAGDFPAICHEVLSKRPMRNSVGDMRIAEVNELLDRLAAANKEDEQLVIFTKFYNRMNADELTWLIRIILRIMKMGATERSIFNVSSNKSGALMISNFKSSSGIQTQRRCSMYHLASDACVGSYLASQLL
jgi:DNA ligase-4